MKRRCFERRFRGKGDRVPALAIATPHTLNIAAMCDFCRRCNSAAMESVVLSSATVIFTVLQGANLSVLRDARAWVT
jgi:hypothetical protein